MTYVTKSIPSSQPPVSQLTRPWGLFSQYANHEDVTFGNWQQADITRYADDFKRLEQGE